MSKNGFLLLFIAVIVVWGCSSNEGNKAYLQAKFTGELPVDSSSVTSDLDLTVIDEDTAENTTDTLFHQRTQEGELTRSISFGQRGQYPLIFSWKGEEVGRSRVILADKDTIKLEADLSNIEETFSVTSRELEAIEVFDRLNRGFQRVSRVISAGRLTGDSLRQEVNKWSDLFWEVHEERTGTIGSDLAARESIRLLRGLDDGKMMHRIRELDHRDEFIDLGINYGKDYIADTQGLDSTLTYLDSLSDVTGNEEVQRQIGMQKIKILYDSARVADAQQELATFKEEYPDASAQWIEAVSYDLSYLSRGDFLPQFKIRDNGDTLSNESMEGSPYILEITRLANRMYQNQFDRTVVIHSLYKNYGLEIITIPLDESQITVDAFFEERVKAWPVADAQSFDRDELLEEFNIRNLPTRFLVDGDGKIVRKYVGGEYDEIIKGIQTLINQEKSAS